MPRGPTVDGPVAILYVRRCRSDGRQRSFRSKQARRNSPGFNRVWLAPVNDFQRIEAEEMLLESLLEPVIVLGRRRTPGDIGKRA